MTPVHFVDQSEQLASILNLCRAPHPLPSTVVIDLRRLRDDSAYRAGVEKKGIDATAIDAVLDADERRRSAMHDAEQARAAQNSASKEIGRAEPNERESKIAEASRLKAELDALEALEDSVTQ